MAQLQMGLSAPEALGQASVVEVFVAIWVLQMINQYFTDTIKDENSNAGGWWAMGAAVGGC